MVLERKIRYGGSVLVRRKIGRSACFVKGPVGGKGVVGADSKA